MRDFSRGEEIFVNYHYPVEEPSTPKWYNTKQFWAYYCFFVNNFFSRYVDLHKRENSFWGGNE